MQPGLKLWDRAVAKSSNLQQAKQPVAAAKCCKQADLLLLQLLLVRLSSSWVNCGSKPDQVTPLWGSGRDTQTEQLLFQIDRACEVGGEDG